MQGRKKAQGASQKSLEKEIFSKFLKKVRKQAKTVNARLGFDRFLIIPTEISLDKKME